MAQMRLLCLLVAALFLAAPADAGSTLDPCTIVTGTFDGVFVDDDRIRGAIRGDLDARRVTIIGKSSTFLAEGVLQAKSKVRTADGRFNTREEVTLLPGPTFNTLLWVGRGKIRRGRGEFEGYSGSVRSFGLL